LDFGAVPKGAVPLPSKGARTAPFCPYLGETSFVPPFISFFFFSISFGGWQREEGGGILGRVRSAWGVRSVARLRLFTELRRYSLHQFCGRSCSLLLALSGVGGRTWKSQPRLVKEGFCSRPIWSFLLSTLFHQLSHTGLSLLGRKLQMERFSLWNQGVVGEVDIREKGLFSGGEKKIFFF
jgi:hypothetical protein